MVNTQRRHYAIYRGKVLGDLQYALSPMYHYVIDFGLYEFNKYMSHYVTLSPFFTDISVFQHF